MLKQFFPLKKQILLEFETISIASHLSFENQKFFFFYLFFYWFQFLELSIFSIQHSFSLKKLHATISLPTAQKNCQQCQKFFDIKGDTKAYWFCTTNVKHLRNNTFKYNPRPYSPLIAIKIINERRVRQFGVLFVFFN